MIIIALVRIKYVFKNNDPATTLACQVLNVIKNPSRKAFGHQILDDESQKRRECIVSVSSELMKLFPQNEKENPKFSDDIIFFDS